MNIKRMRTTFRLVKSDVSRYHNVYGHTWTDAVRVVFKLYALKGRYLRERKK